MAEPPSASRESGPGYRLDAQGRQEAEDDRLSLLEQIFDPHSRRRRGLARPGCPRCGQKKIPALTAGNLYEQLAQSSAASVGAIGIETGFLPMTSFLVHLISRLLP